MSHKRAKTFGEVTITVTLEWDEGDSSTGISPGWGENTCAEIKAGPFVTWVTWVDGPIDVFYQSGRFRHRERVTPDPQDPATWLIDDIETGYRFPAGGGQGVRLLTLADRRGRVESRSEHNPTLRLSDIPAVLEVVREAFEDYKAAERLSVARESVLWAESYIDELASHGEEDEKKVSEAKAELDKARAEEQEARRHAEERST